MEPAAKQLGGDTDTKSLDEAEAEAQEVDQSKKDSAVFAAQEAAKKAAEEARLAAQKAAEEAELARQAKVASRNPYDGLIHHSDGSRWDADTDTVITGVN